MYIYVCVCLCVCIYIYMCCLIPGERLCSEVVGYDSSLQERAARELVEVITRLRAQVHSSEHVRRHKA